ncbi:hypothetical protein EVAR_102442_1 [Eumeta japonica]|uniref:Uncharacterized protein n=1 Tax=Eumeta variegata TaxID=151549 RepID=A0A4C1YZY4_EUMVA|nr:hypothetical protein EVAR_102442_1 [Eumeta japonica]
MCIVRLSNKVYSEGPLRFPRAGGRGLSRLHSAHSAGRELALYRNTVELTNFNSFCTEIVPDPYLIFGNMFSAPNKILTVEYWYQIFQFPGLEKFVNFLHSGSHGGKVEKWRAAAPGRRYSISINLGSFHFVNIMSRAPHELFRAFGPRRVLQSGEAVTPCCSYHDFS